MFSHDEGSEGHFPLNLSAGKHPLGNSLHEDETDLQIVMVTVIMMVRVMVMVMIMVMVAVVHFLFGVLTVNEQKVDSARIPREFKVK